MRERKLQAEFANFVCHFGSEELLHYLDEIVIPAFFSGEKRSYGRSRYFIHEPKLVNLATGDATPNPAIVGRFVVDKILDRQQIFDGSDIVESPASMPTAPSTLFVLTLRDHKLIFVKEVPGAPGFDAFRSTVERLFSDSRSRYIDKIFNDLKKAREEDSTRPRVTKKSLTESISGPLLQIVPLTGKSSINSFLKRFSLLKEVRVRLITPNSEIDNSGLFDDIRGVKDAMGAETASISYKNNEKGLNLKVVASHVSKVGTGNAILTFVGDGKDGAVLNGDNHDFKAAVPISNLPDGHAAAARTLYKRFLDLVQAGLVSVANQDGSGKYERKLHEINRAG